MLEEATRRDHSVSGDALVIHRLIDRVLGCMAFMSPLEAAEKLTNARAGTPEHIFLAVKAAEILCSDCGWTDP